MSRANPAPKFWRCGECGTPNPTEAYVVNCLGCGVVRPADTHLPTPPNSTSSTKPREAFKNEGRQESPKPARVRSPKPSKSAGPSSTPRWRFWLGWLLLITAWLYAASIVGVLVLIAILGERWWPTTFILFSPRWVMLFPLAALVPLGLVSKRRAVVWPLLAATLIVLGPGMGLCFPWQALLQTREPGQLPVRLVTCNIEGGAATGLDEFVASLNPHVVVMQECPQDGPWAKTHFRKPGWNVHYQHGIGIATRLRIIAVEERALATTDWTGGHIVRYTLETRTGQFNVFAVHLKTPRPGLEAVMADKLAGVPELEQSMTQRWQEAADAAQWASESKLPYLIAGDFNMPADSPIYRESFGQYLNAFAASGIGYGQSKFTRWFSIRIDHILAGPGWIARRCRVGRDVGSDHRPVVADLEWSSPQK